MSGRLVDMCVGQQSSPGTTSSSLLELARAGLVLISNQMELKRVWPSNSQMRIDGRAHGTGTGTVTVNVPSQIASTALCGIRDQMLCLKISTIILAMSGKENVSFQAENDLLLSFLAVFGVLSYSPNIVRLHP